MRLYMLWNPSHIIIFEARCRKIEYQLSIALIIFPMIPWVRCGASVIYSLRVPAGFSLLIATGVFDKINWGLNGNKS